MGVGLLLARAIVGLTVGAHGLQKLTARAGGHGIKATGEAFEQLGFRPGKPLALLAGLAELIGGALLALGFLLPFGAFCIVAMMASAIIYVHGRHGFFADKGGVEYPLVLGVVAATSELTGAGRYSLDHLVGWNLSGPEWFGAVVGCGLFVSALTALARLHRSPVHRSTTGRLRGRMAA